MHFSTGRFDGSCAFTPLLSLLLSSFFFPVPSFAGGGGSRSSPQEMSGTNALRKHPFVAVCSSPRINEFGRMIFVRAKIGRAIIMRSARNLGLRVAGPTLTMIMPTGCVGLRV